MNKKTDIKFEFNISGLVIALFLISGLVYSLNLFINDAENELGISGNNSLDKYNKTSELIQKTKNIQDNTSFKQEEGLLDVIGAYFRNGYTALKIAGSSINTFEEMSQDLEEDIPVWNIFSTIIIAIVIIGIFIGVVLSVLLKLRI